MRLKMCEGNKHWWWQSRQWCSRPLPFFKRGKQEHVLNAPLLNCLPHHTTSLLHLVKGQLTILVTISISCQFSHNILPIQSPHSHLSGGISLKDTRNKRKCMCISTQQILLQSTLSQESTARRGWQSSPHYQVCPSYQEGPSDHMRCVRQCCPRCRQLSHLPSSLQGSATLQRGGRGPLPWGIPGHCSTVPLGNLQQEKRILESMWQSPFQKQQLHPSWQLQHCRSFKRCTQQSSRLTNQKNCLLKCN